MLNRISAKDVSGVYHGTKEPATRIVRDLFGLGVSTRWREWAPWKLAVWTFAPGGRWGEGNTWVMTVTINSKDYPIPLSLVSKNTESYRDVNLILCFLSLSL